MRQQELRDELLRLQPQRLIWGTPAPPIAGSAPSNFPVREAERQFWRERTERDQRQVAAQGQRRKRWEQRWIAQDDLQTEWQAQDDHDLLQEAYPQLEQELQATADRPQEDRLFLSDPIDSWGGNLRWWEKPPTLSPPILTRRWTG